jgi:hypothetical protein
VNTLQEIHRSDYCWGGHDFSRAKNAENGPALAAEVQPFRPAWPLDALTDI